MSDEPAAQSGRGLVAWVYVAVGAAIVYLVFPGILLGLASYMIDKERIVRALPYTCPLQLYAAKQFRVLDRFYEWQVRLVNPKL